MEKMIEFMKLIGQLKRVRRTGWLRKGAGQTVGPESVADHMYRMAVLAFLIKPAPDLDQYRCMKIALVHDMAESIVGDLTPQDGVSKEEKHRQEEAAMQHMCSLLDKEVGQEVFSLWQEYEGQQSRESEMVKDLDKFEMILQAFEYEQIDERPGYLQEFFDTTHGKFKTEQVQEWVAALEASRKSSQKT